MRSGRRPVRLTKRGERALALTYTVAVLTATSIGFLAALGLAGWIEGGCK